MNPIKDMKIGAITWAAIFGALFSLYGLIKAVIAIALGLFSQDWSRMEPADSSARLQNSRLAEVLHANYESGHQMVVVLSKISRLAQELAFDTLAIGFACFVLFCAIVVLERKRRIPRT